jgi:hypothetical protein
VRRSAVGCLQGQTCEDAASEFAGRNQHGRVSSVILQRKHHHRLCTESDEAAGKFAGGKETIRQSKQ